MIEIESTAGHYGLHLVERQIDLVETVSRTVSDQPSDALSHQTLVVWAQVVKIEPTARFDLALARVQLVAERFETANDVEIWTSVGSRVVVLLTEGDDRSEFLKFTPPVLQMLVVWWTSRSQVECLPALTPVSSKTSRVAVLWMSSPRSAVEWNKSVSMLKSVKLDQWIELKDQPDPPGNFQTSFIMTLSLIAKIWFVSFR